MGKPVWDQQKYIRVSISSYFNFSEEYIFSQSVNIS